MLKLILAIVFALVATIPSTLIAQGYLQRRDIPVGPEGTVKTFMDVAPGAWKAALVTLNFVCMIGLFTLAYVGFGAVFD